MGVVTNLTITDGVLVYTTETWTLICVLICTIFIYTLFLISLLILYKWTGQRHNVTGLDTTTPPTADVQPRWSGHDRRQRGTGDRRNEEKKTDPSLVAAELGSAGLRRRLAQAELAARTNEQTQVGIRRRLNQADLAIQRRAKQKKQKRRRNKQNKWYRANVSQMFDDTNLHHWSDFCNEYNKHHQ
jgi:hypothetical protein